MATTPTSGRVWPASQWPGVAALLAMLALSGCATYSTGIAKVERETGNRDLDGALKSLDALKLGGADQLLYYLNKGMLLRLKGDYQASNQQLESAKHLMDKLAAISLTEQTGSALVNDTVKAYEGTDVEQLLIYAFKELDYLQSGNVDEAAVEARQFDIKQRLVAGNRPDAKYLSGAFVRYLNGMTYEEAGEPDAARIDYQKAVDGYTQQAGFSGFAVPDRLKAGLARLTSSGTSQPTVPASPPDDNGEVVFVLHDGLGPTLAENIVSVANPQPLNGAAILSIAVPRFVQRRVPVARFELSEENQTAPSEVVADINALARKSLEARLPAITARAVARMALKNAMARNVKKQGGDVSAADLLMNIASDVGAIVTERADTRSWSLLPGRVLLARLALPAGVHTLTVKYYGHAGDVLETRHYDAVKVSAGRRVFISDYFLGAN